ncbi:sodium:solute symporter family transporter [Endozoicomonas ascidiicola]|uniref:sodium:solute symporter family transporter n=1 Tax=Endozoicomonas ascidiicola TaxID=1698521 RepID=UPI00083639C1|nr:sodium/substrate symport [Endozoicomonas ascidiicola]
MVSTYDLMAIIFYFVFMVGLGMVFNKQVSNTSEYFRGGGKMLWWMTGASAFMTSFSAWTFTGAAGKAYADGFTVAFIFVFNVVGYLVCGLYFAPKFRQMRVITPMQALRQRFGKGTEQVHTWVVTFTGLLGASITLIAVSVFISAVIGWSLSTTIIITGVAVVFMSVMGGSWAVVASDFIQCLLIVGVSIVTFLYSYNASGGFVSVIENFPAESFIMGNGINFTEIFLLWVAAIFIQRVLDMNNMGQSVRFLCVKDSAHARKSAYFAAVLFGLGSIIWFFPPMFAAIEYPDLASMYPTLGSNSRSAAYLVIVQQLLPAGMLGLVVAAMFSATMSTLDSRINFISGTFVKNFYQPILRPEATEENQLMVGRIATGVMGTMVIAFALFFTQLKGFSLFQIMIMFAGIVNLPLMIPQMLGIIVRKVPDWAGWATVIFGLGVSLMANSWLNAGWFADALGVTFTSRETSDLAVVITQLAHATLTVGFFFATGLFYKEPVGERKEQVDTFFRNVNTPVISPAGASASDNMQRKKLGILSMIFGGAVCAMALLPNERSVMAFVLCGGFMLLIGYLLYRSRNMATVEDQEEEELAMT